MGDSSTLSLSLECIFGSTFPQWGPFSRIQSWELIRCWDHLGSVLNWTQLRPLCKLLRFQWVRAKIYLPYRHQNIFLCKFPCLLNLYLPLCLFLQSVPAFHVGKSVSDFTQEDPKVSNQQFIIQPGDQMGWEIIPNWSSIPVWGGWTTEWVWDNSKKPAGLMCLFEELLQSGGMNGYIVGGSYYEQVCGGHWCLIRGWLSR